MTQLHPVTQLPKYRTKIAADWIDYNGHLRDAYYGLIFSCATDDMMDRVGLHAEYRARTRCTLYTLEMHLHFLHEVKSSDEVAVQISILAFDRKRIHVSAVFSCERLGDPVASAEAMMLHVQQNDKPASTPFPAHIQEKLAALVMDPLMHATKIPGSRKIELQRR